MTEHSPSPQDLEKYDAGVLYRRECDDAIGALQRALRLARRHHFPVQAELEQLIDAIESEVRDVET
jgi:hypothetical protein